MEARLEVAALQGAGVPQEDEGVSVIGEADEEDLAVDLAADHLVEEVEEEASEQEEEALVVAEVVVGEGQEEAIEDVDRLVTIHPESGALSSSGNKRYPTMLSLSVREEITTLKNSFLYITCHSNASYLPLLTSNIPEAPNWSFKNCIKRLCGLSCIINRKRTSPPKL